MSQRRSFFHGAFVLMTASLVTRVMGFAYRIVLTRLIGATGMGLFQMVSPLLSLVLTFVIAGLPVAISKLVAEALVQRDRVRVQRILRVSATVIAVMSVLFTGLMWLLRGVIQHHWLTDPRAYPTYLAMIPLVSIIGISSIFRGYFQGLQDMSPLAWSAIFEQILRIGSIWLLASYLVHYSLAYAAAAAMAGQVVGELGGLLFLWLQYRRKGKLSLVLPDAPARSLEKPRQTLAAIVNIAAPVTLSRLIGSLIYALEPVLVTRSLLTAGLSVTAATALYGQYGGMAIPLLVFPTVFTGSLAVNLVPSVSEAVAENQEQRVKARFSQSWTATAMVGIPTSILLTFYANPLAWAVFGIRGVGPILAVMAPAGFLLYLEGPLMGILQGLNHAGIAMRNSIVGGILRLGLIVLLASQPHLGILGVAWASTASICVTAGLHLRSVKKFVPIHINWRDTLRILVASAGMLTLLVTLSLLHPNPNPWQLLLAMMAGLIVNFILLCSLQVLTTQRVLRIPRAGPLLAQIVSAMPFAI
ncbi:stage V sporulation protein B [Alicyclobacillaceae bacterium I2511]|nr:stage V sporulation protein B [Alicyclobacillaceae bacterium I2511]